jgi:hypothetical protein
MSCRSEQAAAWIPARATRVSQAGRAYEQSISGAGRPLPHPAPYPERAPEFTAAGKARPGVAPGPECHAAGPYNPGGTSRPPAFPTVDRSGGWA